MQLRVVQQASMILLRLNARCFCSLRFMLEYLLENKHICYMSRLLPCQHVKSLILRLIVHGV